MKFLIAFILFAAVYIGVSNALCARLYQHYGYKGKVLKLYGDNNNFSKNKFNDMLSSYRVEPGCKMTLYEHSRYRGRKLRVTGSGGVPACCFNDIASSARCNCPGFCARLFKHYHYRGTMLKVGKYHPNFSRSNFNDVLSSYIVKGNCRLTIYQHSRYRGFRMAVTGRGNVPSWWNDQASSSKCTCSNIYCARLYQHYNYKGRLLKVGTRNSNLKRNRFNDILSSYKVQPGCVLTIYQNANYRGFRKGFTGRGNVPRWWNDKASSTICKCY